jgi:hypothetical protein
MAFNKSISFTVDIDYINKSLLYRLVYARIDDDGFEYMYDLFDLAQDPSIIDKVTNL